MGHGGSRVRFRRPGASLGNSLRQKFSVHRAIVDRTAFGGRVRRAGLHGGWRHLQSCRRSRLGRHRHRAASFDVVNDGLRQAQLTRGGLIADLVPFFHDAERQNAPAILQDNGVCSNRLCRQQRQTDRNGHPRLHRFILGLASSLCHVLPCSAMPKVTTLLICGSGWRFPGFARCSLRRLPLARTNLLAKPTSNSPLCASSPPASTKSKARIASSSVAATCSCPSSKASSLFCRRSMAASPARCSPAAAMLSRLPATLWKSNRWPVFWARRSSTKNSCPPVCASPTIRRTIFCVSFAMPGSRRTPIPTSRRPGILCSPV